MGIMRAWKGPDDRKNLSEAARPANPAGDLVLTEEDLGAVVGGSRQDSDPCEGGEGQRS